MSSTLGQRLIEVSKELGWVAKKGKNKEQGYAYVQAVDIFDSVREALSKHGVVFSHSVTDQTVTIIPREGKSPQFLTEVKGEFAFINPDDRNDVIAGSWAGQALDTSDKGTWKAITGGLKYILIGNQLLPTGDDPENDDEVPTRQPTQVAGAVPRQVAPPIAQKGISEAQQKMLRAKLKERGLTVTESQKWFNHHITQKYSTKEWTQDDFDKVIAALDAKDEDTEALVLQAMAAAA